MRRGWAQPHTSFYGSLPPRRSQPRRPLITTARRVTHLVHHSRRFASRVLSRARERLSRPKGISRSSVIHLPTREPRCRVARIATQVCHVDGQVYMMSGVFRYGAACEGARRNTELSQHFTFRFSGLDVTLTYLHLRAMSFLIVRRFSVATLALSAVTACGEADDSPSTDPTSSTVSPSPVAPTGPLSPTTPSVGPTGPSVAPTGPSIGDRKSVV